MYIIKEIYIDKNTSMKVFEYATGVSSHLFHISSDEGTQKFNFVVEKGVETTKISFDEEEWKSILKKYFCGIDKKSKTDIFYLNNSDHEYTFSIKNATEEKFALKGEKVMCIKKNFEFNIGDILVVSLLTYNADELCYVFEGHGGMHPVKYFTN